MGTNDILMVALPSIIAVVDALSNSRTKLRGIVKWRSTKSQTRYIVSVAVHYAHPYALNHPYVYILLPIPINSPHRLTLLSPALCHYRENGVWPLKFRSNGSDKSVAFQSLLRTNVLRFVSESPVMYISFYALSIITSRGFLARTWLHAS